MKQQKFLISYKIFFGFLAFTALVTELVTLMSRGTLNSGNFFSYFTIESNILAVASFVLSALVLDKQRKKGSSKLDMFRGAVTLYMVTTGIVFSFLLSGLKNVEFTAVPWDNIVLHYIVPVAMLIDWLIHRPAKQIDFRDALVWILYPLAYVGYSLIRGVMVSWYPYPFLDPASNGYVGVAVTSFVITLMAIVLIWLLTQFTRRSKSKR